MTLTGHLVASTPLTAAIFLYTNSWSAAVIGALASVLVDVDHVSDYIYNRGGWYGLRDFFDTCNAARLRKTVFVFHSWEWPILYAFLFAIGVAPQWLSPVFLGVTYHFALDTATNPVPPSFYWLTKRAMSRFDFARFYLPERKGVLQILPILRGKTHASDLIHSHPRR